MEKNLLPFLSARKCNLIRFNSMLSLSYCVFSFSLSLSLSFSLSQRSLDDRNEKSASEDKRRERELEEREENSRSMNSFDEFARLKKRKKERKKERKKGIITPLVGVAKLHLVINERKPVEEKAVFYHGKWCSMLLRSLADNLVCDPRKGRK